MASTRCYVGKRRTSTGQEWEVCHVDGRGRPFVLDPRHDLANHSPDGFSWGFSGSGPAQLALAILAHYFTNLDNRRAYTRKAAEHKALQLYQTFKAAVIAAMDQESDWTLTAADVDSGIAAAEGIMR